MKLEEKGLVVEERSIGYSVADLDVTAVFDLVRVREPLDICAAELACARATEEDLARTAGVVDQIAAFNETAGSVLSDQTQKLELGVHIYKLLAKATYNESLLQVSEQVYYQLQLAPWRGVLWIDFDGLELAEHGVIARPSSRMTPQPRASMSKTSFATC